ncbi:uncharacterized protein LOC133740079 isoform X5 [Rosa rugosa]|uniref:uncharacterized protein LOC133734313 isoform X5 n=1 Tax=Rosa rugosa TaxID=74645 RepID=UPI002B417EEC|nr:uncharacterized protein LOC133734313 isoform X5 [Rosa rugosa]XP_062023919.1 uncharacterized protein LOC133740079 isoform X5 [Rosa rugosa]
MEQGSWPEPRAWGARGICLTTIYQQVFPHGMLLLRYSSSKNIQMMCFFLLDNKCLSSQFFLLETTCSNGFGYSSVYISLDSWMHQFVFILS